MAENEPKSSQRDIVILQLCEYITIITETGCESLACVIILDELDDHVSVFFVAVPSSCRLIIIRMLVYWSRINVEK